MNHQIGMIWTTTLTKLTNTVPPKRGPMSQGLNINNKKGRTLQTENKWQRLTKRYPTLNKK